MSADFQEHDDASKDQEKLSRSRMQVERIMQLARKKGEQIIDLARQEAIPVKQQAYDEGFQQGFEDGIERGRAEGVENFKKSTEDILKRLQDAENDYYNHITQLLNSLEPRIIDIVLVIAKTIIKKEIERDDELVLRTIREASKNLTRRDKVLLTSHRSEVDKIAEESRNIIQSSDMISDIEVVPGDQVDKGGVIISSSEGSIDARIDSQMEVISDIFNS
jgi:flagellar assembly protein FliH